MREGQDDNTTIERVASKQERVHRLVEDLLERRRSGEVVSEERLSAAHPELQPELDDALRAVRAVQVAVADARLAGPAADPIQPLSLSKLDEPLDVPEDAGSDALDDASGDDFFTAEGGPTVDPRLSIEGFELLEEVGEPGGGGQARVFKARQVATERIVAVKVLHGGPYLGSRARKRYWREVRILGRLNHPNIVGVLNRARTADGSFFLVMDFVEGERLDDYLDEHRASLTQRQVLSLLLKIIDAVAEAHRHGIVHRDLKPSNVRVDARGEPHVLDFGLARLLNEAQGREASVTAGGYLVGTLPWASPEQAEGDNDRVREPSDAYSLGVITYRLLTGRFPYPVELPPHRIIESIRDRKPTAPSSLADAPFGPVDAKLEAILLKALAKRPEDRYANAGALAEELRRYLADRPLLAPSRRDRRRRFVLRSLPLLFVPCLVAYALVLYFGGPAAPAVIVLPSQPNSVGMTMIDVPTGRLYFGTNGAAADEGGLTAQLVRIDHRFAISATEVTRRQWGAVMGGPTPQGTEADLPVDDVSWDQAVAFCRRLGAKEGVTYRLPSEAEWEYVCRAGRSTHYGGNDDLGSMGWYAGNSGGHLHPVAKKFANHWGVYDMHGNVEEWCWDAVGPLPDAIAAKVEDGGPGDFRGRVRRGGGFKSPKDRCTASWRTASPREAHFRGMGFRVVRDDLPSPAPNE